MLHNSVKRVETPAKAKESIMRYITIFLRRAMRRIRRWRKGDNMQGKEYQKEAMRTNDGLSTARLATCVETYASVMDNEYIDDGLISIGGLVNGCLGLSGEAGEVSDMIKKWIFHGSTMDEQHLKKEIGDVMWYIAMICESMGWSMDEVMELNIAKLKKRYPDGFDTERANSRDEEDV